MQLLYAAAGTALRRQLVPLNFSKLRNVDRVDPLYVQNCRQKQSKAKPNLHPVVFAQ